MERGRDATRTDAERRARLDSGLNDPPQPEVRDDGIRYLDGHRGSRGSDFWILCGRCKFFLALVAKTKPSVKKLTLSQWDCALCIVGSVGHVATH